MLSQVELNWGCDNVMSDFQLSVLISLITFLISWPSFWRLQISCKICLSTKICCKRFWAMLYSQYVHVPPQLWGTFYLSTSGVMCMKFPTNCTCDVLVLSRQCICDVLFISRYSLPVRYFLYPDSLSVRYFLYPGSLPVRYFLYPDSLPVNSLFLK